MQPLSLYLGTARYWNYNDWTMARPALARVAAARADVVGFADRRWQSGRYVNFGLHWTRATPATARLAVRVANRSEQAWDQFVWNVELAAAAKAGSVACCSSPASWSLGSTSNSCGERSPSYSR